MALGNKKVMANNIRHYMELNDIDRNKLCEDLGLKYMTVSDWINANTYPRIDKIELLANYFGIRKSDLVEDKNIIKPISPILPLYNSLEPPRQKKVVDYAKKQLREQMELEKHLMVNAAHERTDIIGTKEMKDHDNDIMDDENF